MFDYNPTTVPPEWHGWLEGINDFTPNNYNFPKPIYGVASYKSRTGTELAYNPKGSWVSRHAHGCMQRCMESLGAHLQCAQSHGRPASLPCPLIRSSPSLLPPEQPAPEAQLEEVHDLGAPASTVRLALKVLFASSPTAKLETGPSLLIEMMRE